MENKHLKNQVFKQREERIVKAAFDLFAEHGTDSVTIDMIAETAGVGKGTVYKHFSSKNDIFATLIIRLDREMMAGLYAISQDAPVMVQLKKTMQGIWDFQLKDLRRLAVFRKCDQLVDMNDMAPDIRLEYEQQNHLKNQFIRNMIEKAIKEEIFADKAIENLSAVSVGLFRGVFDLILQGEVEPTQELYDLVERMILKGFMR